MKGKIMKNTMKQIAPITAVLKKPRWYKSILKFIGDIFSESSDISSMRIVFVCGSFFTLCLCALLTYKVVVILSATPQGLAVLAIVLGAIFTGCIGLVGALAATKAWQAKSELTATEVASAPVEDSAVEDAEKK